MSPCGDAYALSALRLEHTRERFRKHPVQRSSLEGELLACDPPSLVAIDGHEILLGERILKHDASLSTAFCRVVRGSFGVVRVPGGISVVAELLDILMVADELIHLLQDLSL